MFAVIETGGKQYKVGKGDVIFVEKLGGDAGAEVTFDKVMMVADGPSRTIGRPYVSGAAVVAEVLEQMRAPKIIVFRKKRRQNFRRKRGHRQHLSVLRITDIRPGAAA
ncbi:MAG: 50S ribosomal protein L21 [Alphaproteobacteria bacterium]